MRVTEKEETTQREFYDFQPITVVASPDVVSL